MFISPRSTLSSWGSSSSRYWRSTRPMRGDPGIVLLGPDGAALALGVDPHRAELVDRERPPAEVALAAAVLVQLAGAAAIEPDALLGVEHRAARAELDREREQQEHRRKSATSARRASERLSARLGHRSGSRRLGNPGWPRGALAIRGPGLLDRRRSGRTGRSTSASIHRITIGVSVAWLGVRVLLDVRSSRSMVRRAALGARVRGSTIHARVGSGIGMSGKVLPTAPRTASSLTAMPTLSYGDSQRYRRATIPGGGPTSDQLCGDPPTRLLAPRYTRNVARPRPRETQASAVVYIWKNAWPCRRFVLTGSRACPILRPRTVAGSHVIEPTGPVMGPNAGTDVMPLGGRQESR